MKFFSDLILKTIIKRLIVFYFAFLVDLNYVMLYNNKEVIVMKEPEIFEANELRYETIIAFPRIVAEKHRYQDIEMIVYKVQYFYGGYYYEKATYDKNEAISELQKLCKEIVEND